MTVAPVSRIPNPVIPGFNPDPSVIRVGEDYFLATSTFEYFPGVPIYHSKDLVNWTIIGHALNRPSQLLMHRMDSSGGIYAPTLRYNKGRYYMATACIGARNNRLVSLVGPIKAGREADTGGRSTSRGGFTYGRMIFSTRPNGANLSTLTLLGSIKMCVGLPSISFAMG